MSFKRDDKVVISLRTDMWFGQVGIVSRVNGQYVDVYMRGHEQITRVYMATDLSSLPLIMDDDIMPSDSGSVWKVDVDFIDDAPPLRLQYGDRQPSVTWGDGMVRIESEGDINLLQMNAVRGVRVHR